MLNHAQPPPPGICQPLPRGVVTDPMGAADGAGLGEAAVPQQPSPPVTHPRRCRAGGTAGHHDNWHADTRRPPQRHLSLTSSITCCPGNGQAVTQTPGPPSPSFPPTPPEASLGIQWGLLGWHPTKPGPLGCTWAECPHHPSLSPSLCPHTHASVSITIPSLCPPSSRPHPCAHTHTPWTCQLRSTSGGGSTGTGCGSPC